jgi:succinate-semialdehyde dehydrogenase / glutarate-semialdehyde dehydrogenase
VQARVQNNGQSCIAAKRFIVHRDCYDKFEEAFVAGMAALSVGDPMDPATEVGPLALAQGRDEVHALVEDARGQGAAVLCGGAPVDGPGYFYAPTVITGITPKMRVATEEVFGPVALLYRVDDAEEALRVANDTCFGLGASVWTTDAGERRRFVQDLEVGMVFVNAMVVSTLDLPFGGTKLSGYGRELSGLGIREFCDAKSVWEA